MVYFKEVFGEWSVGVFFGIESFVVVLIGYFFGRLIDRYGVKRFYFVLIVGYVMVFVFYVVVRNVWLVFGVVFFLGIMWIFMINLILIYVVRKVSVLERV